MAPIERIQRMEGPGPGAGVQVSSSREYHGGYDDGAVEKLAAEDGQGSFHDPSVWGENTEPRVVHVINSAVAVLRGLAGHAFRQESVSLELPLESAVPEALIAQEQALDDIEDEEAARVEAEGLAAKTRDEQLVVPQREDVRRYLAKLAGLALGDLAFIAVAFQVFGLSDRLLLGFVPFTSELHIAAFSSVLALLFLAHHAGEEFSALAHLRRRRHDGTGKVPPSPGVARCVVPAIWVTGAALVLVGVAAVREAYLAARGVEAHTWVFVAIQSGVFLAALALSMSHAHPFARDWERVSRRVRRTIRVAQGSAARHAELVGRVNGLIDRRLALFAMAAQHVRIAEADAVRQVQLYLRRVQLSQPEPVGERLFPAKLPAPAGRSDKQLEGELVGLGELPGFDRLDVGAIVRRREQMRKHLNSLSKQGEHARVAPFEAAREAPLPAVAPGATNGTGAA